MPSSLPALPLQLFILFMGQSLAFCFQFPSVSLSPWKPVTGKSHYRRNMLHLEGEVWAHGGPRCVLAAHGCSRSTTVCTASARDGILENGDHADAIPNIQLLQAELESAIAKEDYADAARIRDRLTSLRADHTIGVLECNHEFYRALREGDFKGMDVIWLDDEEGDVSKVTCAHPGAPLISGRKPVLLSWSVVLQNPPNIRVENTKVIMYSPTAAAVMCEEHIASGAGLSAICLATNIFVYGPARNGDGSKWYISHHHAGPMIPNRVRIERSS